MKNLFLIQSTIYWQEAVKLSKYLNRKGIKHVFLKGLPMDLYFFKQLPKRLFADVDLLIKPSELARVEKFLLESNYRRIPAVLFSRYHPKNSEILEWNYCKQIGDITVVFDIHLQAVFLTSKIEDIDNLYVKSNLFRLSNFFLNKAKLVRLQGHKFYLLPPLWQLLYLALHLFHHNYVGWWRYQQLKRIIMCQTLSINQWKAITNIILMFDLQNYLYPIFVTLNSMIKIPEEFINDLLPKSFFVRHFGLWFANSNLYGQDHKQYAAIKRILLLIFLSPRPWKKRLTFIFRRQFWLLTCLTLLGLLKKPKFAFLNKDR